MVSARQKATRAHPAYKKRTVGRSIDSFALGGAMAFRSRGTRRTLGTAALAVESHGMRGSSPDTVRARAPAPPRPPPFFGVRAGVRAGDRKKSRFGAWYHASRKGALRAPTPFQGGTHKGASLSPARASVRRAPPPSPRARRRASWHDGVRMGSRHGSGRARGSAGGAVVQASHSGNRDGVPACPLLTKAARTCPSARATARVGSVGPYLWPLRVRPPRHRRRAERPPSTHPGLQPGVGWGCVLCTCQAKAQSSTSRVWSDGFPVGKPCVRASTSTPASAGCAVCRVPLACVQPRSAPRPLVAPPRPRPGHARRVVALVRGGECACLVGSSGTSLPSGRPWLPQLPVSPPRPSDAACGFRVLAGSCRVRGVRLVCGCSAERVSPLRLGVSGAFVRADAHRPRPFPSPRRALPFCGGAPRVWGFWLRGPVSARRVSMGRGFVPASWHERPSALSRRRSVPCQRCTVGQALSRRRRVGVWWRMVVGVGVLVVGLRAPPSNPPFPPLSSPPLPLAPLGGHVRWEARGASACACAPCATAAPPSRALLRATWLILPVVICLSQRLSHACLSISDYTVKLRMAQAERF